MRQTKYEANTLLKRIMLIKMKILVITTIAKDSDRSDWHRSHRNV